MCALSHYRTFRYARLKIVWGHRPSNLRTWQHGASAADPIIGALHGSAVAIASARFIPEILSTGNAIDVRF